jgi:hypothetical protein
MTNQNTINISPATIIRKVNAVLEISVESLPAETAAAINMVWKLPFVATKGDFLKRLKGLDASFGRPTIEPLRKLETGKFEYICFVGAIKPEKPGSQVFIKAEPGAVSTLNDILGRSNLGFADEQLMGKCLSGMNEINV